MHGPKPCVLPLDDGPVKFIHFTDYGGEGGIRTHGEVLPPHTLSRRAPSASSVTSPEFVKINHGGG